MKLHYKCYGCHKKGIIGSFQDTSEDFFMEGWRTDSGGTRYQIIICNSSRAIHDVYPSLTKAPLLFFFRKAKMIPIVTKGYFLLSDITSDAEENIDNLNSREVAHYGYSPNDRVIDHIISKDFFDQSYKKPMEVSREEFLLRFKLSNT